MTLRVVVAAVAVVVGFVAGCSHPTGPTPQTTTVVGLKVGGPSTIAPGQTVQFTATASLSNGTTADYTRKVNWSAFPTGMLTITRDTGQATGLSVGDVTIQASYLGSTSCCQAQVTSTVLLPNTYRLTGKVLESGLPVQSAAIAVLTGIGAGLSTTTDADGAYRLYGVAGTIQVKFSKPGYVDIVKPFTATQNDVLDFPEAHQATIPSLAGTYTLTLTADPTCPTSSSGRIPALPDDFRQPRTYAASVTQNGPSLTVTLTDPGLVTGLNQFSGRVEPDAIVFEIGSYYYGLYGGIAEQVSSTQQFEFGGQVYAQRSGDAIVGRLDGTLEIVTLPSAVSAECVASNHQVTLTRAAKPSRRR